MNTQLEELVFQSLEHELGGVEVYTTAVECAVNADLKEEWTKYLAQTKEHTRKVQKLCEGLGIDPAKEVPGRQVVRFLGQSLVEAMRLAQKAGNPVAAELVACECVVLAETKDHADWELLRKCAEHLGDDVASVIRAVAEEVEDEEDEHLYHSKGWCRELWLKSLGISAVLPPPEERQHVKTAIGAARAEKSAELLR